MQSTVQSQSDMPAESATAAPSPAYVQHRLRSRRVLGIAAAVAGVAAASGGLVLASGGSSPVRVDDTSTSVPAAYAPGGSVYDEQVPDLARAASLPVPAAYAPGGSVYNEQVPSR